MHITAARIPARRPPAVSCTRCGVATATAGGLYLLAAPVAAGFVCGDCWSTAEGKKQPEAFSA